MNAAQSGPVVILNIARERCDALAILPGLDEVVHIPLPDLASQRITGIQYELRNILFSNGFRMRGERAAKKVEDTDGDEYCRQILAELWSGLVKPVLDSLALSVRTLNQDTSRLTNQAMYSPVLKICHIFGGVRRDHSLSSRYTLLAFTTGDPSSHRPATI
jgi:hypothetical protein